MLIASVTFSRARDKFILISKPLEEVAPQPALGLKVHSYGNMLNFKWAKVDHHTPCLCLSKPNRHNFGDIQLELLCNYM